MTISIPDSTAPRLVYSTLANGDTCFDTYVADAAQDQGGIHFDDAACRLHNTTVANAPSASNWSAGSMIYVTNGDAGSACLGVSDGTNWKVVSLGANISAT